MNPSTNNELFEIITEETRRKIVIDYISNNTGCTAEDIVNGQNKIGRVKIFRLIKDLKNEEIITSQISLQDRRKIQLSVNDNNPLVSIPKELDQIERLILPIFSGLERDLLSKLPVHEGYDSKGRYHEFQTYLIAIASLIIPIEILINLIIQIYSKKSFSWSSKIKDKESLNRLHTGSFVRVHFFQRKFSEIIEKTLDPHPDIKQNILNDMFSFPPSSFQESVGYITEYGMFNKTKALLKFLSKISQEDHQLLHAKKKDKKIKPIVI